MKYEVRCCCTPGKLLGHLSVGYKPKIGHTYQFPYLESEVRPQINYVELEFNEWCLSYEDMEFKHYSVAFKSKDQPLDLLVKLPNFSPAIEKLDSL